MSHTYNGNYPSGITLSNFGTNNPVTILSGNVNGVTAFNYAWTIDNYANISYSGFAAVHLSVPTGVGFFTNGSSGKVADTGSTGSHYGIDSVGGTSATIVNHGTVSVTAVGGSAFGIDLFSAGIVTNDGLIQISANGAGGGAGIVFNTVGTVVNSGTVAATGTGGTSYRNGIYIEGGNITNLAGGLVSAASGSGIGLFSFGGGAANISNAGTVLGKVGIAIGGKTPTVGLVNNTGSVDGGVFFAAATTGTLVNGATAVITGDVGAYGHGNGAAFYDGGTATNTGTITAGGTAGDGITASKQATNVVNYGAITAPSSAGIGVQLAFGGTVKNEPGKGAALISGGKEGVYIEGGAGTVANYGQILGSTFAVNIDGKATVKNIEAVIKATAASSDAVSLAAGGALYNDAGGQIAGGAAGISALGATTIGNAGTITGTAAGSNGVVLAGGGTLSNRPSTSFNPAAITGNATGLDVLGAAGTVINYGTIAALGTQAGTASYAGVRLADGGVLSNGASLTPIGLISASRGFALDVAGAAGDIANYGTLAVTAGTALELEAGGVATSDGAIIAIAGNGVVLKAGGTFGNSGFVGGTGYGVQIAGSAGSFVNYGTVQVGTDAVYLEAGQSYLKNSGVLAAAASGNGVLTSGAGSTIINVGDITGGAGIILNNGGLIVNQAGGVVSATIDGVLTGPGATLANSGTIAGSDGVLFAGSLLVNGAAGQANVLIQGSLGVALSASGATFTNFGTVSGTGGTAVKDSGANDVVVAEPSAVFHGSLVGDGGGSTLQLAAGQGTPLLVSNFGTVQFTNGASWEVVGSATDLNSEFVGFAAGDTIDLLGFVASTSTFASDSLVLTDGSNHQVTLAVQGTFASNGFTVAAGSGGTDTLITLGGGPQSFVSTDPLMTNTSGSLVFDQVVGGQMVFTTVGGLGPEWEFDGSGEFLGAGNTGLLIRNDGTVSPGTLFVGTVTGSSVAFTQIGGLGTEWQFVGNADFLGTGQSEFLIRNVGSVEPGTLDLGQVVNGSVQFTQVGGLGTEWQFEGTGNFLGDGHQGFLFRNTGTVDPGALYVGEIVNGAASFTPIGGVGTEWDFEGVGDFLGDGHTDFLIRNNGSVESGALAIGEVVNGQLSFTDIGGVGQEWQFVGTGNYIDKNRSDFLMRNAGSGALVVGSFANSTLNFTTVGAIGPEWTFHNTDPALLA